MIDKVIAVTNAGLAIGQGTWSSLIVLVSFFWGEIVFKEPLKAPSMAIGGLILLIFGSSKKICFPEF